MVSLSPMSSSSGSILGIENGTSPLLITIPFFVTKGILQSNPLASASNFIDLNLETNFIFTPFSTVTVSNMLGSMTQDTLNLPIASSPQNLFGAGANWSKANGILQLTVQTNNVTLSNSNSDASNRTQPGWPQSTSFTKIKIRFQLQNGAVPQSSPPVSISATVYAGRYNAPVSPSAMDVLNQSAVGVDLGANPLFIIVPAFVIKQIGQSTPLASASNTITITFQANCNIAPSSLITFTNLVGSQTASTNALPVLSSPSGAFGLSAAWTSGSGSLVVNVSRFDLLRNTTYTVWFELQNSATSQQSPSVSIAASIEAGLNDSPVHATPMSSSLNNLLGVAKGEAPLRVQSPDFVTFDVNQSTPFPGQKNVWIIKFQLSVDLQGQDGSVVMITGSIPDLSSTSPVSAPLGPPWADFPLSAPTTGPGFMNFTVLPNSTAFSWTTYIFSVSVTNPSIQNSFSDLYAVATGTAVFLKCPTK